MVLASSSDPTIDAIVIDGGPDGYAGCPHDIADKVVAGSARLITSDNTVAVLQVELVVSRIVIEEDK